MRRLAVAFLVGAGALVASLMVFAARDGGGESARAAGDPAAFVVGVVRLVGANRYAEAWDALDPAQQRLVSKERYVSCESLTPVPGRVGDVRVLRVAEALVPVPGRGAALPAKSVTLRIEIVLSPGSAPAVVTHTYHAAAVEGRWRWFLPDERLRTYRAGDCPGYSKPPSGGASA